MKDSGELMDEAELSVIHPLGHTEWLEFTFRKVGVI